jgi:hypothetical protein
MLQHAALKTIEETYMKPIRLMSKTGAVVIATAFLAIVITSRAQETASVNEAPYDAQQPTNPASPEAQREQIWNSPDMLRARAWLQDYCSKSPKVTPEQGKKYMKELANMTPSQMEVYLLKFDHEEQQRQQQYSFWQQAHEAGLSRAMAANQATEQAYANINRQQTEAAGVAQQQVDEQAQTAQTMAEQKQLEMSAPYAPYGYAGYGGVHYHFHLYPYPY